MKTVYDWLSLNYHGRVVVRTTGYGHPQCWKLEEEGPAKEGYEFEFEEGEGRDRYAANYDKW